MNYPFVICVSDGVVMRTLQRPAFSPTDLAALDALLQRTLFGNQAPPVIVPPPSKPITVQEVARQQGYSGNPCDVCGSFKMRRNGTCQVCEGCGTTTGCS